MKIVIYEVKTDEDGMPIVPINGFFEPIVSQCYGIFSNDPQKIDENRLEMSLENCLENETAIFYVPSDMKNLIKKLLTKFTGKEWGDKSTPDEREQSKKQLQNQQIGWNELSPFIEEKMDVIEILEENNVIQELFDKITSENTNIDAVFLARTERNARKPIWLQSERANINVNIDAYNTQVQRFIEYVDRAQIATPGFQTAFIEFKKGITSITRLGENRIVLLFFVNTTGEDFATFDFFRSKYLPQIERLLLKEEKG